MDQQTREGLRAMAAAIRIGSEKYPKCTGQLFGVDAYGRLDTCCVLGAAIIGRNPTANSDEILNMEKEYEEYSQILALFGLENIEVQHPIHPDDPTAKPVLTAMLYYLNDTYEWDRGDIANWLAVLSTEGADGQ